MGTPIVLKRQGTKKKKKAKKTDIDHLERGLYRAASRTVSATGRGMKRYDKARKRSSKRERDGAVIDIIPNVARGMAITAAKAAPVPLDLVRAGYTPSMRRVVRRSARSTTRMLDRS